MTDPEAGRCHWIGSVGDRRRLSRDRSAGDTVADNGALGIVPASKVEPTSLLDRILSEANEGGTLDGRSEIGAGAAN